MAKVRHIAIRAEDTEKTAKFLVDSFGLTIVQRRGHGPIDLTDGDVNITLLPMNIGGGSDVKLGFDHIGFSVEDEEATHDGLLERGAEELNPVMLGNVYYEKKYKSPEGLVLDVGHWAGASPLPTAAEEPVKA